MKNNQQGIKQDKETWAEFPLKWNPELLEWDIQLPEWGMIPFDWDFILLEGLYGFNDSHECREGAEDNENKGEGGNITLKI